MRTATAAATTTFLRALRFPDHSSLLLVAPSSFFGSRPIRSAVRASSRRASARLRTRFHDWGEYEGKAKKQESTGFGK